MNDNKNKGCVRGASSNRNRIGGDSRHETTTIIWRPNEV